MFLLILLPLLETALLSAVATRSIVCGQLLNGIKTNLASSVRIFTTTSGRHSLPCWHIWAIDLPLSNFSEPTMPNIRTEFLQLIVLCTLCKFRNFIPPLQQKTSFLAPQASCKALSLHSAPTNSFCSAMDSMSANTDDCSCIIVTDEPFGPTLHFRGKTSNDCKIVLHAFVTPCCTLPLEYFL